MPIPVQGPGMQQGLLTVGSPREPNSPNATKGANKMVPSDNKSSAALAKQQAVNKKNRDTKGKPVDREKDIRRLSSDNIEGMDNMFPYEIFDADKEQGVYYILVNPDEDKVSFVSITPDEEIDPVDLVTLKAEIPFDSDEDEKEKSDEDETDAETIGQKESYVSEDGEDLGLTYTGKGYEDILKSALGTHAEIILQDIENQRAKASGGMDDEEWEQWNDDITNLPDDEANELFNKDLQTVADIGGMDDDFDTNAMDKISAGLKGDTDELGMGGDEEFGGGGGGLGGLGDMGDMMPGAPGPEGGDIIPQGGLPGELPPEGGQPEGEGPPEGEEDPNKPKPPKKLNV